MSWTPIGALRHRLRLETPIDVSDGIGGFSRSYRTIGYLWARVDAIAAGQQFSEQKFEQTTSYQIDLRWRADVVTGMRFVFRERMLLIHAVRDPDGARRFLTCACEEIA